VTREHESDAHLGQSRVPYGLVIEKDRRLLTDLGSEYAFEGDRATAGHARTRRIVDAVDLEGAGNRDFLIAQKPNATHGGATHEFVDARVEIVISRDG
jgi:hypothetical protein